ncbi:MAG: PEF-CTERM sorting domain-containing protein [ANME-2 cluster archaeon]|jgi:hypothetical protein|nr:PEF-CTERM sorting domain-containing protein [ANME-2 cluster archaeon]
MNKIISKLFVTIILLAIMPVVCADEPDPCATPTYLNEEMHYPNLEKAEVDGISEEWDKSVTGLDFFKEMKDYGERPNSPVHLSNAYVRFDNEILYVMVLLNSGEIIDDNVGFEQYVMEICGDGSFLMSDFDYILDDVTDEKIGWEASANVEPRIYKLKVETQVVDKGTSSIGRCIDFRGNAIPEFPTIALPIAAILGLMFILQNRRRKED